MQYEIKGGNLPAVVCTLERGESIVTESGGMSWMTSNMKMETHTGGGIGKALSRMFANEHMFQNTYTAEGDEGMIAFSSSFPGEIRALKIRPGKGFIIQKGAYLASEPGVVLETYLQKKLAAGLFGGEGFIMSKLSGEGTVFLEIDGAVVKYELDAGDELVVSTGYVAAMDDTCTMEIQTVKGVKNVLFGGESIFNTIVKGPGRVFLQTMPLVGVASALRPYLPSGSSSSISLDSND